MFKLPVVCIIIVRLSCMFFLGLAVSFSSTCGYTNKPMRQDEPLSSNKVRLMKVKSYQSAKNYLQENLKFLEEKEAINGLLLGLAIANKKKEKDDTLYLTIQDEKEILFTAIKTVGRNLIVYGNESKQNEYNRILISYLRTNKIVLPGIIGPKNLVLQLGELIKNEFNWEYKIGFKQLVYILEEVKYNPKIKGKLKKVKSNNLDLISKWMNWFCIEALKEKDKKGAYKIAKNKILNGEVYIWIDNSEVTMSCTARPTNNGITINYVYTPIEFRNKGYGTKIVAKLSHLMLEKGYKFCTLFTDLDNPTSNNIYKKIGYEPIAEFRLIEFIKNVGT